MMSDFNACARSEDAQAKVMALALRDNYAVNGPRGPSRRLKARTGGRAGAGLPTWSSHGCLRAACAAHHATRPSLPFPQDPLRGRDHGVLAVSELHGRTLPATRKRSRMCGRRQAPVSLLLTLLGPGGTCAWWASTWVGCGATGSTDGRVRHTTATAPTTGLSARAFCPEDHLRARPVEGGREGPAGFVAVLSHWGRRTLPLPTVSLRLGGDHNRQ